jgi:hypothetical protein
MNVGVGETKFPDFSLLTHDNYRDILEIKKQDASLLKLEPAEIIITEMQTFPERPFSLRVTWRTSLALPAKCEVSSQTSTA